MMLRRTIALVVLVVVGLSHITKAAEWGVLPLPRHMLPMQHDEVLDAIAKVRKVNASVYMTLVNWRELEPRRGSYQTTEKLGGVTYTATLGMTQYFGISTINTTRRDLPEYLKDIPWNDFSMSERFRQLLLKTRGKLPVTLPYFIIGNEVDVYLEKHPDEIEGYLAFYRKASAMVKEMYPQAKVGITVTYDGLRQGRGKIIEQMVATSDAAFFTFYPTENMKPLPPEQAPKMLDDIIAAAQDKSVILQEVGYTSSAVLSSSEEKQAQFFDIIIPAINARPQIKMANIFALYDMEPEFCKVLVDYYGISWPTEGLDAFKEFLCSLGVIDGQDKPKAAWPMIERHLSAPAGNE